MKKRNLFCSIFQDNRARFAAIVLLTVLTSLEGIAVSWLLGAIIDATADRDMARLLWLIKLSCANIVVFFLLNAAYLRLRTRFIQKALVNYKEYAFSALTRKSISAFSQERTGRYLSVLTNDVAVVEEYLSTPFDLLRNGVMFIGALSAILLNSWWQALAILVLCILPVLIAVLLGKPVAKAQRRESDENEQFVSTLKDTLSGFSVIKAFRAERAAEQLFRQSNEKLEDARFRRGWAMGRMMVIGYNLSYPVMQFGVFFFMAVLAIRGMATVGTVAYFTNLVNFILQPIQEIPQLLAKRRSARELIGKLSELLQENTNETQGKPVTMQDEIYVDHLSYSYEGDTQALNDITLHLAKSKKYALVGGSGSGKSTLLKLLMGNFSDYQGSVTLDGVELREASPESLYDLMGLIEQNVFLFDSTLRDNVTMFQSFPDAKIRLAIERAGLSQLVSQKGYDYACGEHGQNLSGGERQRVSIARSLLRETPVLLLDEATASLDAKTAYQVTDTILKLDGLTELIVTHRLEPELLKQYDEIIVLKDGQIWEQGTFDALMERKGYFYSLFTIAA